MEPLCEPATSLQEMVPASTLDQGEQLSRWGASFGGPALYAGWESLLGRRVGPHAGRGPTPRAFVNRPETPRDLSSESLENLKRRSW